MSDLLIHMPEVRIQDEWAFRKHKLRSIKKYSHQPALEGTLITDLGWSIDKYYQFACGIMIIQKVKGISTSSLVVLRKCNAGTLSALAGKEPARLLREIETNRGNLRKLPSMGQVEGWIEQAKEAILEEAQR